MTHDSSESGQQHSTKIDSSRPHSARIWNYWLGGKDNYAVDREVGDEFIAIFPGQVDIARHSRAFLGRAVRYLAADAEIRQFLDLGTGLPTVDNTHEVAQRVAPEARIVYVDNDPLVLTHARALREPSPDATTSKPGDSPTICAVPSGSRVSSPGWSWSPRAWSRSRGGGSRPTRSAFLPRWTGSAGSRESPSTPWRCSA